MKAPKAPPLMIHECMFAMSLATQQHLFYQMHMHALFAGIAQPQMRCLKCVSVLPPSQSGYVARLLRPYRANVVLHAPNDTIALLTKFNCTCRTLKTGVSGQLLPELAHLMSQRHQVIPWAYTMLLGHQLTSQLAQDALVLLSHGSAGQVGAACAQQLSLSEWASPVIRLACNDNTS